MKKIVLPLVLLVITALSLNAGTVKLPDFNALEDLPVHLAADFTNHDDVASWAIPALSKSGKIFFVDFKLKQLVMTDMKDRKLVKIAGEGEGPKEYGMMVSDIQVADNALYVVDFKRKVLCFNLKGAFQWEKRPQMPTEKFLGVVKDRAYLMGDDYTEDGNMVSQLHCIQKEGDGLKFHQLPVLCTQGMAIVDGKPVAGGAFFKVCSPAAAIIEGVLTTSASREYRINRYGDDGVLLGTIELEAPEPHATNDMKAYGQKIEDKIYSVRAIFPYKKGMAAVSNYYKGKCPRIDFFSADGQLEKSYILPFPMAEEHIRVNISGDYLTVTDLKEVGFKVYEIKW